MNEVIARINDAIVELNNIMIKISNNDTVEFDADIRLNVLEVAVDDLGTVVDDAIEFTEETSG